jgi:hypothetical protein
MFYQIHKGLKALLYETAMKIQHTDFWNVEEADEIIERVAEVVRLFEKHAGTEDALVFPLMEKYDPAVGDAFEQEHVKDHLLGSQLNAALAAYRHAAVITDKAEAGREIQLAFSRFLIFNLEHMAKEEDIINQILWRHYTDAELAAVTQQIVSTMPPDYLGIFSKWMMRGLSNAEISGWLREVEKNAPEPVFQGLFAIAEKELPERRFRLVLESLTEGAMLA